MALVILILITGILMTLYVAFPKKIKRRENAFLFMLILNINISISWLIAEEWKWIELPKKDLEYISFLLYRSVSVPLIVLIFLGLFLASRSLRAKGLTLSVFVLASFIVEKFVIAYSVYKLVNWEISYSLIYYLFLLIVARMALLWYQNTFYIKNQKENIK